MGSDCISSWSLLIVLLNMIVKAPDTVQQLVNVIKFFGTGQLTNLFYFIDI